MRQFRFMVAVCAAAALMALFPGGGALAQHHGGGKGNCGQGKGHGGGEARGKHQGNRQSRAGESHHETIHELMSVHGSISRTIVDIDGGVRTETTSDEPEVAAKIRLHARQMKERLESGQPIRRMDPLFREIFEHSDKVTMEIVDIPKGVRVLETSKDPQVVLLIREHAKVVSEFVARGMSRMHEPSALPEDYRKE